MRMFLVSLAERELGVRESPEPGISNPRILQYAEDTGLTWYKSDSTSWCGIFVAAMFKMYGWWYSDDYEVIPRPSKRAATAREWLHYGRPIEITHAKMGDVVVFWRESIDSWKGHVAFFIGVVPEGIICLGGNQDDSVCYKIYPKERLLGIRRYIE